MSDNAVPDYPGEKATRSRKALLEKGERQLEIVVGLQIRIFRQQLKMIMNEVAEQAGLSQIMLSKIEHGITASSLGIPYPLTRVVTRTCGKSHLQSLELEDLVALTVETAAIAEVPLAGIDWSSGVDTYK